MGFALLGRAGPMFPDPTAEAAARHVSLLSGMFTILRNPRSRDSAPVIDSLCQDRARHPEERRRGSEVELEPQPVQIAHGRLAPGVGVVDHRVTENGMLP